MSNEIKCDIETATRVKRELELRLKAGESLDTEQMRTDAAAYLEVERGIFKANNPIDTNCQNIPPWEREPYQILRPIDDPYFTPDETGLTRRFVEECWDWLAWNPAEKKWYAWIGDHWNDEGADLLAERYTRILYDSLRYELPVYMSLGVESVKGEPHLTIKPKRDYEAMVKAAAKIRTQQQIVNAARAELPATFDTDRRIPFQNGMFNPENCELCPHAPENYNTTVSPVRLNLNAPPFPDGERFFNEISCGDQKWTAALFRVLGECLLYGNPHQVFFVFYGSGANGKGVLVDWLQRALGNLTGAASPTEISKQNQSGRQTSLVDTVGRCRIVFFKETGGVQYDEEIIKSLTGEKRITLTRIFTGPRELEICATPILITNTLPTVDKGGVSMMRRQIGFPFDYQVQTIDEGLLNRLATDAGNEWLICQMVKALMDAQKPDAPSFKDSLPDRVKRFTQDLIHEADIVLQFLDECCERSGNDAHRTSRHELYIAFSAYAYSDLGKAPTPMKYRISEKTFGDRLRAHNLIPMEGQQRTSNNQTRRYVYPGIILNQTGTDFYNIGGY